MPELPEVETMCRGIRQIEGNEILSVQRARCRNKPILVEPSAPAISKRLRFCRIDRVERLGKRAILLIDNGDSLVFEPRMTGLLLLAGAPDKHHLRLRVTLAEPPQELWFWDRRGLGTVRLLSPSEREARLGPDRLGPDALRLEPDMLAKRVGTSRRPVKNALMDQQVVAGIGNLYASELLHAAKVHPATPCCHIDQRRWKRITTATVKILGVAIEHEGSTLSDGTYRNALNGEGGYQNHHQVYDREGERCKRCRRGRIRRLVQAGRSSFFCPICQPAPRFRLGR